MTHTTLTSKGQMTIPFTFREQLNLQPGDTLEVLLRNGEIILIPLNKSIKNLKGCLPKPKRSLSVEDMNNVLGRGLDL